MIFTKNYFDKENIDDIELEDVVNYFKNPRHENDKIEYKSFITGENESKGQKEKAIIGTISAFLNSEGGLLIWGAPVGKKVTGFKEKVFSGDLSLVEYFYEKDQFISKISDSITPLPKGILFRRIESDGKFAYIIEAPQSEYSPHQFDGRFYLRIDGQSKPAPYHFIEALFKKIKYPNLNGYIKIENWQLSKGKFLLHISVWIFNLSPLQNDYNLAYRVICDRGVFQGWENIVHNPGISFDMQGHEKRRGNVKDIIHYGEPVRYTETIIFDPYEIQNIGTVNISLLFGAKFSPIKISTYKLTLPLSPEKPNDFNIWFREIKENQMMGEGIKSSEEDRIKKILGR